MHNDCCNSIRTSITAVLTKDNYLAPVLQAIFQHKTLKELSFDFDDFAKTLNENYLSKIVVKYGPELCNDCLTEVLKEYGIEEIKTLSPNQEDVVFEEDLDR